MPQIADRVAESTTTTGTGTLTLGGALSGGRTFASVFAAGALVPYSIGVEGATEYEVGVGLIGSGTLSREIVFASSNSGAKVSLSAGTKEVTVTLAASIAMGADMDIRQAGVKTSNTAAQNATALTTFLGLLGENEKTIRVQEAYPMDPVTVSHVAFIGNNIAAQKGSAPQGGTPGPTALPTGGAFIIDDTADPAFTVGDCVNFETLIFHYVQPYDTDDPSDIIVYPPTIAKQAGTTKSIRVRRCAFVGCWQGISLRGTSTSDYVADVEIEQNYAYPLGGNFLDLAWVLDIPRVMNNHVNPGVGASYLGARDGTNYIAVTPEVIDSVCINGEPPFIWEKTDEFIGFGNFVFGNDTAFRIIDSYGQLTNCSADQVRCGAHITLTSSYKYVTIAGFNVIPSAGSGERNGIEFDGDAGCLKIIGIHGILSTAAPVPSSSTASANALIKISGTGAQTVHVMAPTKAVVSGSWAEEGIDKQNDEAVVYVWPDVPPFNNASDGSGTIVFEETFAGAPGDSLADRPADIGGDYIVVQGGFLVSTVGTGYGISTGGGNTLLCETVAAVLPCLVEFDVRNLGSGTNDFNVGVMAHSDNVFNATYGFDNFYLLRVTNSGGACVIQFIKVAGGALVRNVSAAISLSSGNTARIRWGLSGTGTVGHAYEISYDGGDTWSEALAGFSDSSPLSPGYFGLQADYSDGSSAGLHLDNVKARL